MTRRGGLYLHVPFCGAICSYCHFARTADHDLALRQRTVRALISEFEIRRRSCSLLQTGGCSLATVYIGGGTPSLLGRDLMAELLTGTVGTLPTTTDLELTAEANPESLSPDLAAAWRDLGINRISLGVQSLDPRVLKLLGRRCDPATARVALDTACKTFSRVSADWILGPGLQRHQLLAELDEAIDGGVEHISLYILELHEGTPLQRAVSAGTLQLLPDQETEDLYLACVDHLAQRGLPQYEVSNFARPGAESRHNQSYWRGVPYLALGPSASGFWGRRRYTNERSIPRYLAQVEAGVIPEEEVDPLDGTARRLEAMVLPLRTVEGVLLKDLPPQSLDLAQGEREGLWTVADGRLRLTARGFLRIDTVESRLAACVG